MTLFFSGLRGSFFEELRGLFLGKRGPFFCGNHRAYIWGEINLGRFCGQGKSGRSVVFRFPYFFRPLYKFFRTH